jgi:hypothetical protein
VKRKLGVILVLTVLFAAAAAGGTYTPGETLTVDKGYTDTVQHRDVNQENHSVGTDNLARIWNESDGVVLGYDDGGNATLDNETLPHHHVAAVVEDQYAYESWTTTAGNTYTVDATAFYNKTVDGGTADVTLQIEPNNLTEIILDSYNPVYNDTEIIRRYNKWYYWNGGDLTQSGLDTLKDELLTMPVKKDGVLVESVDLSTGALNVSVTVSTTQETRVLVGNNTVTFSVDTDTEWQDNGQFWNTTSNGNLLLTNEDTFSDGVDNDASPFPWARGDTDGQTSWTTGTGPNSESVDITIDSGTDWNYGDGNSDSGPVGYDYLNVSIENGDPMYFEANLTGTEDDIKRGIGIGEWDTGGIDHTDGIGCKLDQRPAVVGRDDSGKTDSTLGYSNGEWMKVRINYTPSSGDWWCKYDWEGDADGYTQVANGNDPGTHDMLIWGAGYTDAASDGVGTARFHNVKSNVLTADKGNWTGDTVSVSGTHSTDWIQVELSTDAAGADTWFNFEAKDSTNTTTSTTTFGPITGTSPQNLSQSKVDGIESFENHRTWFNMSSGSTDKVDSFKVSTSSSGGDSTAPTVTIHDPAGTVDRGTPWLNVTADEAVDTWIENVDGGTNQTFTPNKTLESLSDGGHTVNVYANDSSGNMGKTSQSFTVDTTAPSVSYNAPSTNGGTYSQDWLNVDFSGSDSEDSALTLYEDFDGTNTTSTDDADNSYADNHTGLSDGAYTYKAYAEDNAGNTGAASQRSVTLDTTPPTTSDNWTKTGWQNQDSAHIELTCTDATTSCNQISYRKNSGSWTTVAPNTTVDFTAEGNHTLEYNSTDTAGNTEAVQTEYVALDTPPRSQNLQDNATGRIRQGASVSISIDWQGNVSGINESVLAVNDTGTFTNSTVQTPLWKYSSEADTLSATTTATGIYAHSNGDWYIADFEDEDIDIYRSNWTHKTSEDISGDSGQPRDLYHGNDGNWYVIDAVFDEIDTYDSSWVQDLDGTTYIGSEDTNPQGLEQNNTGHWFLLGDSTETVYEYNSTWGYTGVSRNLSAQVDEADGLYRSPDGTWWVGDAQGDGMGVVYKYYNNWTYTGTQYALTDTSGAFNDLTNDTQASGWRIPDSNNNAAKRFYSNEATNAYISFTHTWQHPSFGGTLGYRVYGRDTDNQWNSSDTQMFTVNTPPTQENASLDWQQIGGKPVRNVIFGYSDVDGADIRSVSSAPEGSQTSTNATSTVSGWTSDTVGHDFDWAAKAFDIFNQASPARRINFTVGDNFDQYASDRQHPRNESMQVVNETVELDIRGDPVNVSLEAVHPNVTQNVLTDGNTSQDDVTGTISTSWEWVVDWVSTTAFGEEQDNTSTATLGTQYIFRAKQLENNGTTRLQTVNSTNLSVSGTCTNCDYRQIDIDEQSTVNETYNASNDWVTGETEDTYRRRANNSKPHTLATQYLYNQTNLTVSNSKVQFIDVDLSGTCSVTTSATVPTGTTELTQSCNNATYTGDFITGETEGTYEEAQYGGAGENNLSTQHTWNSTNLSASNSKSFPFTGVDISSQCSTTTSADVPAGTTEVTTSCENSTFTVDYLDEQEFDFTPDTDEITLGGGQTYIGTRALQVAETGGVSWTDVVTTAGVTPPEYCSQTNNTAVDVSADAATNYTVEFSCKPGHIDADLTQITDADAANDTHYWYNSTQVNITTNETSQSMVTWKIAESDLNDWDSRQGGNEQAFCNGKKLEATNWTFTDPANYVRVSFYANSSCGSSLTTTTSSTGFFYEVGEGNTTETGDGGGGSGGGSIGGAAETAITVTVRNRVLSALPGGTTFGEFTVRNFETEPNTVTYREQNGSGCEYISVQRTLTSDQYGDSATYAMDAAPTGESLFDADRATLTEGVRVELPNQTAFDAVAGPDGQVACRYTGTTDRGRAEPFTVRVSTGTDLFTQLQQVLFDVFGFPVVTDKQFTLGLCTLQPDTTCTDSNSVSGTIPVYPTSRGVAVLGTGVFILAGAGYSIRRR